MEDRATTNILSTFNIGLDEIDAGAPVVELNEQMMIQVGSPKVYQISKVLVLFVLATMPALFGAVQAWVWSVYTAVIYTAFIIYVWEKYRAGSGFGLNSYGGAIGLFFSLTLLACVPVSDGLMNILSPVRLQLLQQSEMLTGMKTAWPTLSYAPFQSLAWWGFLLGLVLLFLLLDTYFLSRRMLTWSLRVLLVLAVAQGLYGILQALVPNLGVLWVSYLKSGLGDARGTWINRNHFAGFMVMMMPLLLGFSLGRVRWGAQLNFKALLESERIHQHSLFLLALVVMTLALLFSKSRAGIMALMIGMMTFMFLIRGKGRKLPKRFWVIVGSFLALTLLYGLRIGFDPIMDRFLMLDQGNSRLDYWKDSLAIIADHPMGIGLAAFKYVFPAYNVTSMNEAISPHYLHNDMLQLLIETGWLCFLLLAGAYLVFMARSFVTIRRMDFYLDPQKFFIAVGAFSGLVGISFHSLFDFNLQIPANAMYFVVLLAVLNVNARDTSTGR